MSQIEEKCELCKIYARTLSRPIVGMPMATKFNEKVAMELKQWNSRWILHLIDMWSRYTLSVFIDRKKPSNVIDNLMTHWIGKFGVIGTLMTDNGGEYSSNEMREITSILNIQLCTTAGENPFQNGLCERDRAITEMMLVKLELSMVRLILRHYCLGQIWLEISSKCGMVTGVSSLSLEKIPTCQT